MRCVKSVKEDDAGDKKTGKRPPFYTSTPMSIKAELEGHAQEDRREQPISGLRSGDTTKGLLGIYVIGGIKAH